MLTSRSDYCLSTVYIFKEFAATKFSFRLLLLTAVFYCHFANKESKVRENFFMYRIIRLRFLYHFSPLKSANMLWEGLGAVLSLQLHPRQRTDLKKSSVKPLLCYSTWLSGFCEESLAQKPMHRKQVHGWSDHQGWSWQPVVRGEPGIELLPSNWWQPMLQARVNHCSPLMTPTTNQLPGPEFFPLSQVNLFLSPHFSLPYFRFLLFLYLNCCRNS